MHDNFYVRTRARRQDPEPDDQFMLKWRVAFKVAVLPPQQAPSEAPSFGASDTITSPTVQLRVVRFFHTAQMTPAFPRLCHALCQTWASTFPITLWPQLSVLKAKAQACSVTAIMSTKF